MTDIVFFWSLAGFLCFKGSGMCKTYWLKDDNQVSYALNQARRKNRDEQGHTPDMPLDRQLRYACGVQHEYSDDITVNVAYELMDGGDTKIKQD